MSRPSDPAKRYWNEPDALYGIIYYHRREIRRRKAQNPWTDLSWFYADIKRLQARLDELNSEAA